MVTYPPDLESYIQAKVSSGEFRSREDFVVEAAKLYRDIEQHRRELKSDIAAALVESSRGESAPLDIEAIKAELIDELDDQGDPH